MKKILGIVLAVVMLITLGVSTVLSISGETQSSAVEFTVEPVYTVTIPITITPGNGDASSVTANISGLPSDKQVSVRITSWSQKDESSINIENIFLTNGVDYIPFEVRVNNTKILLSEGNNKVLTVSNAEEAATPANITIIKADNDVYVPGTYSGTIVFNITLEDRDEGISWNFPEDDGALLPPIMS